ncbi:MAG TPA: methionine aminotransferase, partial [Cyclobacteriaceae bacterium]|nr:methionine aminotransferase [Cyclobacteriaceae bacterium]
MNISSRLPEVGTSIFTVMSRMALEHGAINLSQGFPDFPVSGKLIDLIHDKMKEGHNQYAPMPGVAALRKAIAGVIQDTYQRSTNFETEITVTAGGTEAIFAAIAALVGTGDEVILFDPAYDSYGPAIRLNGGTPLHINLSPPDFSIDWGEVKKRITRRTRMIMINTPHNPAGSVLSQADLRMLEQLARDHDLIVLSDEVYERIIFENTTHESVLKYPSLAERSIAVFSFGKTFHATGWKVGYTVAPENLTREIRKAHQFITFSVNTPVQLALAEFLSDPENYLRLGKFYQQKRDFFLQEVKGSSLQPLPCFGSYFQLVSYEGISPKS